MEAEEPSEVTFGNTGARGHLNQPVIGGRLRDHSVDDRPKRGFRRNSMNQMFGKLRLSARSLQKQHQLLRDRSRDVCIVIGLDKCQSQIHPCTDATGREDVTVLDKNAVGLNRDIGKLLR